MFITIIAFIIILSALVFVHELGHFYTARKTGVKVEEFGIGIPPRVLGIRRHLSGPKNDKKKWEWIWGSRIKSEESPTTIYSLNWFPIGGFVKPKGEDGINQDTDSLASKSAGKRALVMSAGVIMNMVFAAILLIAVFMIGFPTVIDESIDQSRVRDKQLQITAILPESPADKAGLQTGDSINDIDGYEFTTVNEVRSFMKLNSDKQLDITYTRNLEELTTTITPIQLDSINQPGIGVGLTQTGIVSYPWYEAVWRGISGTVVITVEIVKAFGRILGNLITSGQVQEQIAGPVGIAVLTGRVVDLGFSHVLQFAAILSINLAIINILPFPALDGGRLLFIIIEKIRGRAVSQKLENITHTIGFAFLILLIILVTFKDLSQFGPQIWGAVQSVF